MVKVGTCMAGEWYKIADGEITDQGYGIQGTC
jgi:hypothetical protein